MNKTDDGLVLSRLEAELDAKDAALIGHERTIDELFKSRAFWFGCSVHEWKLSFGVFGSLGLAIGIAIGWWFL
jgi:hypothetical protein